MNITVFCVLGLIVAINATCPENPRERAKQCGRTFRRFGAIAHKDLDKLRSLCPKVYRALDCLREISNDCEMYRRMRMSDQAYMAQKSTIDFVCQSDDATSTETNVIPPADASSLQAECQSKMMTCGKIGQQMINITSPRQMCSNMGQLVSCYEGVQADCQSILPPQASAGMADSKLKYRQMCGTRGSGPSRAECASMMNSCSTMINEFGASGECSVPTVIIACLDQLDELCTEVLPEGQVSEMRGGIQQFTAMCSTGMNPGPGPVNPSSGEESVPSFPPGQGADAASRLECMNMLNGCAQIMSGVNSPNGQMCSVLASVNECFDRLEAQCSNVLPSGQVGQMRAGLSGIAQLCQARNNQKRSSDATKMHCASMLSECSSRINEFGASGECSVPLAVTACLNQLEELCTEVLPEGQVSEMRGGIQQFTAMCSTGMNAGPGPVNPSSGEESAPSPPFGPAAGDPEQLKCLTMLTGCVKPMMKFSTPNSAMCSALPSMTACFDRVEAECPNVLPPDQKQQTRGSLSLLSMLCNRGHFSR